MASRRAPSQILAQIDRAMRHNEEADRVLIPDYWFETDAYGAAVAGILKSVELGLASPSIGMGDETNILQRIRALLMDLDPAINDSGMSSR